FSLVQTSGNLTLASALNLSSATIRLTTSGANANIDLGANAITATSIYLTAAGNIIGTGTLTIGTSGSLNVTSSSGSIGTASNAIAIARTSGIWASTNLILSATNGSIYIKTATSDALAALSAASFRLLATGTFFLEQTAGTLTLASALTFPTATIIIKNNGAIQFNASASITAAAITLSATSFTTANHSAYHLRAPSLSITSSAGDIASETSKLVISSASSEVPDFTSLVVRTPTSNKAYLIRLGTKDTATNALNLIKQSTSPNGTIIFYDQINPTQLLATTSSATKKKQYEGFVSQLLFNLLGSLGADCSKTGLLASLIAKPLCSLKL
ncbi:MAG: hypothetical protein QM538_06235, partial [Methylacidiphilales bacterium]|nr:hypothetical protein [Candidatus Methylacidiphilales bacterium]